MKYLLRKVTILSGLVLCQHVQKVVHGCTCIASSAVYYNVTSCDVPWYLMTHGR